MSTTGLVQALEALVGKRHLLTGLAKTRHYRTGFRSGEGDALAVVFPTSLLMQWKVLQLCVEANCIVIMQAAKTGLTEGSSPSGYDYDRPVVIINGRKITGLSLINGGDQVLAFPGTTLHQLESALKPLGREPHSVIGSSCIGASVIGGIANNSGGALVQRGPAYTQLALYAQVTAEGELQLVNHLGIELGGSPEDILSALDQQTFAPSAVQPGAGQMASDREYSTRVRDIEASSAARYNADPRRLYEASGCAGKLAVFAVRVDTFHTPKREKTFYIGTNDVDQLTDIRRHVLSRFRSLPVLGEYIHRDAFDLARRYGKDTFVAIHRLGTDAMPGLFAFKGYLTSLFNRLPVLPKDFPDRVMQWGSHLFPEQLPERLLSMRDQFEHHLIVKMSNEGIEELESYLDAFFRSNMTLQQRGGYIECTDDEAARAMLHRFAVAGAGVRCAQVRQRKVEDIIALDIALPRNNRDWFEELPADLAESLEPPLYYGHFFCQVFHQDYLVKKGQDAKKIKQRLLDFQLARGAKFPAEHNVGHLYQAEPALEAFYKSLDPTNTFNPGIGKLSKSRQYGCC